MKYLLEQLTKEDWPESYGADRYELQKCFPRSNCYTMECESGIHDIYQLDSRLALQCKWSVCFSWCIYQRDNHKQIIVTVARHDVCSSINSPTDRDNSQKEQSALGYEDGYAQRVDHDFGYVLVRDVQSLMESA